MREARQDAGAGRVVLATLGVMVLGGLIGINGGWPLGVVFVVIVAAFTKSVSSQSVADGGTAAGGAGILAGVLRGLAMLFFAGLILVVGAFVFLYIVCLSQGGGGVNWLGQ